MLIRWIESAEGPGCWSDEWKLLFKDSKCKHLHLSSGISPFDFRYTINDNLVALEDTHRDLGVIISSSLTFTAHYNFIGFFLTSQYPSTSEGAKQENNKSIDNILAIHIRVSFLL